MHTVSRHDDTQMPRIHCEGATELAPIVVAVLMVIISGICLAAVVYGIYRYVQNWKTVRDERVRPPLYIYSVGLIFFIISCLTLCNTLLYDVFYVVCQELAEYESPIYHIVYFCQIYTLWLVLFLRIYYVFHGGMFALSRPIIYAYIIAFLLVPIACIPMFMLYKMEAADHLKLPFVIVSLCFCTCLLVTFFRKLWEVLIATGVDDALIRTTTKNALLASVSIVGTLVVVLVLLFRFVYDKGYVRHHEIWEELVLECAILIDISSNFLCVLLTYKSFDAQYYQICGALDQKFRGCFKKQLDRRMLSQCQSPLSETEKTITVSTESEKSKSRKLVAIIHSAESHVNGESMTPQTDEEAPRSPQLQAHPVSLPLRKMHSNTLKLQRLRSNPVLEKKESLIQFEAIHPR